MPRASSADVREPTEVELPSGTPSRSAAGPRRDDFNKLREGKVGVKWADRRGISTIPPVVRTPPPHPASTVVRQLRQIIQRGLRLQYSACLDGVPASGRAGSPTAAV